MPDSGSAAESPLDRLRRLARESQAAKAAPAPTQVAPAPPVVDAPVAEPVVEEPVVAEPVVAEPTFDEPTFDEPVAAEPAVFDASAQPTVAEAEAEAEAAAAVPEAPAAPAAAATEPPLVRPGPPAAARLRTTAPAADPVVHDPDETPAETSVEAPALPAQPRSSASGRLIVATATLGVLVVLATVGLILAVHHERSSTSPAKERAAAAAAAALVVADVTTFNYSNPNDWLRRVQADSTGGLQGDFANQKDSLTQATAAGKSVAVGKVISSVYCGGQCVTAQVAGNTAAALVYVATTVKTTTAPAGLVSKTRFTVKLSKVGGRWLATNVDYDPVAASS